MIEKAGTEVKGVFDFGGLSQVQESSEVDTAKEETSEAQDTTTTNAPESTKENAQAQTTEQEVTSETTEETSETVEAPVEKEEGGTEKPFEVDGRTFTSKDALVTAYRNSSSEGIRLAKATEEYKHMVNELRKENLALKDAQGDLPFPGLLSSDKEQEAAQLEMLPSYRQTEYIISKKAWEDKQAASKAEREQQKAKLTESEAEIKELITRSEKEMSTEQDKYPGFDSLKPTMAKILELTPSIANRPETPYLSFWIAYGLNAFSKEQALKNKTKETTAKVTEVAKSAHAQVGKSGSGKPINATTSNSGSSIVNAYRDRNGVGI